MPFSPWVETSATTDPAILAPPFPPENVTVTAQSTTSIRVDWTRGIGSPIETSFGVWVSTNGTSFALRTATGAGEFTFTDAAPPLIPATQYWYKVNAINLDGTSAFSSTVSVFTNSIPAPVPTPSDSPLLPALPTPQYAPWKDAEMILAGKFMGGSVLDLDGTSDSASVPDEAALDITGNVTIIVSAAADDWTPAAKAVLMRKGDTCNYGVSISTTGQVQFRTATTDYSTTAVLTATASQRLWIKSVYNATLGTVTVTTSTNGVTYDSFDVITSVPTSLTANASILTIGADLAGTGDEWTGQIFSVKVIDDTTTVLDIDFTAQLAAVATFTATTGQIVTLTGGVLKPYLRDLLNNHDALVEGATVSAHSGTNSVWIPAALSVNNVVYATLPAAVTITPVQIEMYCTVAFDDLTPAGNYWIADIAATSTGSINYIGVYVSSSGAFNVRYRDGAGVDVTPVLDDTLTVIGAVVGEFLEYKFVWGGLTTTTLTADGYYRIVGASTWTQIGLQETATITAGLGSGADTPRIMGETSVGAKVAACRWVVDGVDVVNMVGADIQPDRTAVQLDEVGDTGTVPSSTDFDVATTLDFQAELAADFTPGVNEQTILARMGAGPTDQQFLWRIDDTNGLEFYWYDSGGVSSDCLLGSAFTVQDGTKLFLRVTVDTSTGAWVMYSAANRTDWSVLGSGTATARVMRTPGTQNVWIGNTEHNSTLDGIDGQVHWVKMIVDGTKVLEVDFTNQTPGAATITAETGQVVTLVADAAIVPDGQLRIHDSTPTYLDLPGASGDYASTPDSVPLSVTNDIDLRADLVVPDVSPASYDAVIAKQSATTAAGTSYVMGIWNDGRLYVSISDGTTIYTDQDDGSGLTGKVADGQRFQMRVTADIDDGAGNHVFNFYYRTDGDISSHTGWTALGAAVTVAGTFSSLNDNGALLEIGSRESGTGIPTEGQVFRAQVWDGIAGSLVFDADFTTLAPGVTSFTESSSNAATVTVNGNAAILGGSNKWDVSRHTSGLVTTLVEGGRFAHSGTNDFLEIAHSVALNADGDFTALVAYRTHDTTPVANSVLFGKRPGLTGTDEGWSLSLDTAGNVLADISDGATEAQDVLAADNPSAFQLAVLRLNTVTDELEVFVNGVGSGSATTTTLTESSTVVARLGTDSASANDLTAESTVLATWNRPLTDAEILTAYNTIDSLGLLPPILATAESVWLMDYYDGGVPGKLLDAAEYRMADVLEMPAGTLATTDKGFIYADTPYFYFNSSADSAWLEVLDTDIPTQVLDVRMCVDLPDWTPAAKVVLIDDPDTGTRQLAVTTAGTLTFTMENTLAAETTFTSNALTTLTGINWVRFTVTEYIPTLGGTGGTTVKFYEGGSDLAAPAWVLRGSVSSAIGIFPNDAGMGKWAFGPALSLSTTSFTNQGLLYDTRLYRATVTAGGISQVDINPAVPLTSPDVVYRRLGAVKKLVLVDRAGMIMDSSARIVTPDTKTQPIFGSTIAMAFRFDKAPATTTSILTKGDFAINLVPSGFNIDYWGATSSIGFVWPNDFNVLIVESTYLTATTLTCRALINGVEVLNETVTGVNPSGPMNTGWVVPESTEIEFYALTYFDYQPNPSGLATLTQEMGAAFGSTYVDAYVDVY